MLLGAAADLRRLAVEHVLHVIILGQALRRVEAAEEDPRLSQARAERLGCKLIRPVAELPARMPWKILRVSKEVLF